MKHIDMFSAARLLLFSLPTSAERIPIAVLDFDPKGVLKILASAVSDKVRSEIVETGYFTVLERRQMDAILHEQGFQLTGCTDHICHAIFHSMPFQYTKLNTIILI